MKIDVKKNLKSKKIKDSYILNEDLKRAFERDSAINTLFFLSRKESVIDIDIIKYDMYNSELDIVDRINDDNKDHTEYLSLEYDVRKQEILSMCGAITYRSSNISMDEQLEHVSGGSGHIVSSRTYGSYRSDCCIYNSTTETINVSTKFTDRELDNNKSSKYMNVHKTTELDLSRYAIDSRGCDCVLCLIVHTKTRRPPYVLIYKCTKDYNFQDLFDQYNIVDLLGDIDRENSEDDPDIIYNSYNKDVLYSVYTEYDGLIDGDPDNTVTLGKEPISRNANTHILSVDDKIKTDLMEPFANENFYYCDGEGEYEDYHYYDKYNDIAVDIEYIDTRNEVQTLLYKNEIIDTFNVKYKSKHYRYDSIESNFLHSGVDKYTKIDEGSLDENMIVRINKAKEIDHVSENKVEELSSYYKDNDGNIIVYYRAKESNTNNDDIARYSVAFIRLSESCTYITRSSENKDKLSTEYSLYDIDLEVPILNTIIYTNFAPGAPYTYIINNYTRKDDTSDKVSDIAQSDNSINHRFYNSNGSPINCQYVANYATKEEYIDLATPFDNRTGLAYIRTLFNVSRPILPLSIK